MKKNIALIVALVLMLCTGLPFLAACNAAVYDFAGALGDWSDVGVSANTNVNVVATLKESSGTTPQDSFGYAKNCVKLSEAGSVTYTIQLNEATNLAIFVDYYILHNGLADTEVEISLNGKVVSERSSLKAYWRNESEDFRQDSFGNEIVPGQSKIEEWIGEYLYEYDFSTVLPVIYGFVKGENTLSFKVTNGGDFLLGEVSVRSVEMPKTYDSYIENYKNCSIGTDVQKLEAEHFHSKNSLSVVPTSVADMNVTPYDSYTSVLNTISGFNQSNQIITYQLDVRSDGLYNISFNYQNDNSNRTAYIQVFLDGKTPFQELLRYPLTENGAFTSHTLGNKNGSFAFYLTAGTHLLSVKIDNSLTVETGSMLSEIIDELNDIYLDLKLIAGTISDNNREWDVENDFPGIVERLQVVEQQLGVVMEDLTRINGADINYQSLIYVRTAQQAVQGLLKTPKYIPNKYAQLSEGSGSIVQTLSNAVTDIGSTPVEFDCFVIHGAGSESNLKGVGFFVRAWEGVKKFFHSFFQDYSNVSTDENTIQVWVARSRQYVDLMQQMVDASDFEKQNGYKVKFSILADEGKLILSNAANISPDAVMGISSWLPYEMGIRGLTVDLTQFSDYGQVISRFSDGAMISLIADGNGLALPETQDFYVVYYRKDILEKYEGLCLPDTWDDVINMLPVLQRYGMNFYIPLSTSTSSKSIMTTAPFIYQYGGTLFNVDGTATTISDDKSMSAIKFMTELYTLYGLPQQVSNFFDSFRSGSLPIGISTFETYIRLSMAAPEISGKWAIALAPGVRNADGVVERWQAGSATAVTLLKSGNDKKDAAGWELLKWWTSASVQTEFMNRLTMIYGKNYIWNSANLEAFSNSIAFTTADKAIISQQWEWLREVPKVPGWYMLERELSNAWNSIVIDGENTRSVVEDAVTVINKELKRKLTEFGYLENGTVVKTYKVTTLESVREMKQGGE